MTRTFAFVEKAKDRAVKSVTRADAEQQALKKAANRRFLEELSMVLNRNIN